MSLNRRHIELYYVFDRISNFEKVDVKGISESKLEYHRKYFLDFICYYFDMIQNDGLNNLIDTFQGFYQNYVDMNLDIGYYRLFNEVSSFVLKWNRMNSRTTYVINSEEILKRYSKDIIDITFNATLLREMYQYLSLIYFSNYK